MKTYSVKIKATVLKIVTVEAEEPPTEDTLYDCKVVEEYDLEQTDYTILSVREDAP